MIGKWVLLSGETHYNFGVILAMVGESCFLIDVKTNPGVPPSQQLFTLETLVSEYDSFFFEDEAALNLFVAWMDAPEEERPEPKVLQFKSREKTTRGKQ